MPVHQPFTIRDVRIFDGVHPLEATSLRVVGGRIDAIGTPSIAASGDAVIDGGGGTLLPGLIDAHVHLLPGCTQLAATFGVTTVVDQFSKPEVIDPERAAVAAADAGQGPVRADLRTSSIGATAPGGHPTIAYSPLPYVTGPADALPFVEDRLAEGATHLKVIYDDGSGAMLDIPSLEAATIEALVAEAHRHGLPVVAHVSTARGAVTVAHCGVDVLAHAPFDRMTDAEVRDVARAGVALIATLSIIDGFPGPDGMMPLLTQPELASRLTPRWRRVLDGQSRRWMPPQAPDGTAARENTLALFESGVRVLAGTDAPNPGLVHGASLHRELQHLVRAGLRPTDALTAATSAPADVFGLADRGRLVAGAQADLALLNGDPTADITATQRLRQVWVLGREVEPEAYAGSPAEREGVIWLRDSTTKIVEAIQETWPGIPTPEDVRRDEDGELLGRVVPTSGGWQAVTTFGAPLGDVSSHDEALETVRALGLSCLAEPWWVCPLGEHEWQEARLMEVHPDRVRLRWTDPMADQPPSGQWFDLDDLDLALEPPAELQRH
ncbi:amidohydrolase [Blastococcus sp. KM273128]|uniref:amidohydrolase family protein n=1 Tax=Blastococcus sp. KM273128 TaxID=2570314 RepID=UPI001F46AC54|nr:amidohydrolase family protein [Blastococcus sp. KM273128]MCF6745536.1 amidohydrolase [Blastococcus sp. KM273128]